MSAFVYNVLVYCCRYIYYIYVLCTVHWTRTQTSRKRFIYMWIYVQYIYKNNIGRIRKRRKTQATEEIMAGTVVTIWAPGHTLGDLCAGGKDTEDQGLTKDTVYTLYIHGNVGVKSLVYLMQFSEWRPQNRFWENECTGPRIYNVHSCRYLQRYTCRKNIIMLCVMIIFSILVFSK